MVDGNATSVSHLCDQARRGDAAFLANKMHDSDQHQVDPDIRNY
jgi:hypothetical protein